MSSSKSSSPKSTTPTNPESTPVNRGAYLALTAALLGWLFDGAEMGVFSLVGRPAVKELMEKNMAGLPPAEAEAVIGLWFGVILAGFLVGAATGGVVFGWLGDRIGRVRAMTFSVLTYALFTGLCGFAQEAWQVGALRFIAALGMGGEWSLGVALVMEVWPNRSRAFMAGLIGAAANVGYLMVGMVGLVLAEWLLNLNGALRGIGMSAATADMLTGNNGWRIMMLLGTLPALLTFFIRIFVPESEKWEHENQKGTTGHWATQDLLAVLVGLIGPFLIVYVWAFPGPSFFPNHLPVQIIATVFGLAIATIGYLYPVIRFFQRATLHSGQQGNSSLMIRRMLLGSCLSGVALLGTWGSTQWAPTFADQMVQQAQENQPANQVATTTKARPKEWTLMSISFGAVVGTLLAAGMGDWLGRRLAYFLLCGLSLASVYILFLGAHGYGWSFLFWSFIAGTFTASFYGWLPLYLPELFTTNVRATGQGFGFNFGRILAAIGVLQGGNLMKLFTEDLNLGFMTVPHGYPIACSTLSLVYVVGMVIIWFAPETRGQPLPE